MQFLKEAWPGILIVLLTIGLGVMTVRDMSLSWQLDEAKHCANQMK